MGLLAPFPAIISRFRHGRIAAFVVTLAAAILLALEVGAPSAGLLYLAQCGVVALLLPELLLRKMGGARSVAWTTAANLLCLTLSALLMLHLSGHNLYQLHDLAVSEINNSLNQALALYNRTEIRVDQLEALKQSLASAGQLTVRIYPALTTVLLIVMAGCNMALARRYAPRIGVRLKIGRFREYRNPEAMVWLLIIAGFAMLTDVKAVTMPALNILVVLAVLYFLQGMAVIGSMFFRLGSPLALRVSLYLLLIVQPYTAALISAIGIFDLWGDFRTPKKQENL